MSSKKHPDNHASDVFVDEAEWAETLRGLRRAVASASGSQILICLYDSHKTLRKALEDVQSVALELKMPFSKIELDENGIDTPQALLSELDAVTPENRGLACVTDTYVWLRYDDKNVMALRQLNIYRDLFIEFTPPFQILFFIPDPLAGRFAVECPDLWTYRSGLFLFQSLPEARELQTEELAKLPHWNDTLTRAQKLERVKQIDHALENTLFETLLEKQLLVNVLDEKGTLQSDLGDYKAALKTMRKALSIAEENNLLEKSASVINDIGTVLSYIGDYDGAKEHYERALKITIDIFGDKHPNVASNYNNIGSVYKELGDANKAIEYYKIALSIDLEVFGDKHPSAAIRYSNLGHTYISLGDAKKAVVYYERALKIFLEVFGDKHPNVATIYNNLGGACKSIGDVKMAVEYFERALKIDLEVFGDKHPTVATRYNNLGDAYRVLGDVKMAVSLTEMALEIFMTVFGADHPSTKTVARNLAGIKGEMGKT